MFLNTKLQSSEKLIKIAFIGCGKFVNMFLAKYNQLQKITIDTIVDINIDNAVLKKNINKDEVIKIDDVELNLEEETKEKIEININEIPQENTKRKKQKNSKILNIFVVTIISFVAFIILSLIHI